MKLIDERGRLFGKINLIDFLVIISLFCFIPVIFFTYRILSNRPVAVVVEEEPLEFIETEINCKFIKVPPEFLKQIAVGDKEINKKGEVIGEIIWLGEVKPYQYEFNLGAGQTVTKEDPLLKEVFVKLRLKVAIKDNTLYYITDKFDNTLDNITKKNIQDYVSPISVNVPFDFSTSKYTLKVVAAIIRALGKGEVVDTEINCKFIKVPPELLKQIAVGDKEINKKGEVIGEIIWFGEVKPYQYEFNLGAGQTVTKEDPLLKEIVVKLRLKVEVKDNTLYYKNEQLLVNFPFGFMTKDYSLQAIPSIISKKVQEKRVKIKIKSLNMIPEVANVLREGDSQKDIDGKIVANLEEIVSNEPSEILMMRSLSNWITIHHPFQKDIVTNWNILCIEKNGVLYFNNYPIKIGNAVNFITDMYSMAGTIIGMEIK